MPTFPRWESTVLEDAYDHIDYISMHQYFGNQENDIRNFLAKTLDMENFIRTVVATCDYVKGVKRSRKTINLSFDEWNVWYHSLPDNARLVPWQEAPKLQRGHLQFRGRLVRRLGPDHAAAPRGPDQDGVSGPVGQRNCPDPDPRERVIKQTIFYPFLHASRYGRGTVLTSVIDSPMYDSKDFTDVNLLDIVSVFGGEAETLTIFAVNRDLKEDIETSFTLSGFSGYSIIEHILLAASDLSATNDETHPDRVVPSRGAGGTLDGEKLTIIFPRSSWNVVRLAFPRS